MIEKQRQDEEELNDLELPEPIEEAAPVKEPEIAQQEVAEVEESKPSLEEVIRVNSSPAINEFDWDSYEGGKNVYSKKDISKLEKMYENTFSDLKEKEIINGTVVGITDKDVVLNVGFKSDGLVPLS